MSKEKKFMPVIEGEFWQVAGVPDLGAYNSEEQQPVDFGIWQAADGTWQIWSCIRFTNCGAKTRLFHCWEGKNITDPNWTPQGIAMEADPTLGEQEGGLQSPFVLKKDGQYYMLYGAWDRIYLASSSDGKNFERLFNEQGSHALFKGPYNNTRDCCVVEIDGLFYCYYTGQQENAWPSSAVFCRVSNDLQSWSVPTAVSYGGVATLKTNWFGGDCESPFVVPYQDKFILFRNQLYVEASLNHQYCSGNPLQFGCDNDDFLVGTLEITAPEVILYEGQYYLACLMPGCQGIRIAKLKFEPV